MIQIPRPDVAALMVDGRRVDESLRVAFARTVLLHRRLGLPLVVWQDDRVTEISADRFLLDPSIEALASR